MPGLIWTRFRRERIADRRFLLIELGALAREQTVPGLLGQFATIEPRVGTGQRQSRAEHGVLHERSREPGSVVIRFGALSKVESDARDLIAVALLIGQEETVSSQVQDARRAAGCFEPAYQSSRAQPGRDTQETGDPTALGPRPREPVEVESQRQGT
jgi:hypothetical protein